MSDDMSIRGRLDAPGDMDSFWLDLVAGQRYRIDLHAESAAGRRWSHYPGGGYQYDAAPGDTGPAAALERLTLQWADPTGPTPLVGSWLLPVGGVFLVLGNEDSSFTFTAARSGRQQLQLLARGQSETSVIDYTLSATRVDADDHGDLPGDATPLTVNQAVAGELELGGDRDGFALQLKAGQKIELHVDRGSVDLLTSAAFEMSIAGPSGGLPFATFLAVHEGGNRFVFTAEQEGRYVLTLLSYAYADAVGDQRVSYAVRAAAAGPDDHADTVQGATPLALGQTASLELDEVGDIDWFRLELRRGEAVRVTLSSDDSTTPLLLRADLGQGLVDLGWYGGEALWQASDDATLYVGAVGLSGFMPERGALQLRVEPIELPAAEPARTVGVGEEARGDVSQLDIEDRFELPLEGGLRYRLTVWADHEPAWWISTAAGQIWTWDDAVPYGTRAPVVGQAGWFERSMVIEADADTLASFFMFAPYRALGAGERVFYRFLLEPTATDDHGDSATSATPWTEGSTLRAQLGAMERDVFRVELNADQRYRFSAHLLGGMSDAQMTLRAAGSQDDALGFGLDADGHSSIFTPSVSGSYFVTLRGNDSSAEIHFDRVAADDHADGAAGATWLPIVGGSTTRPAEDAADWVALVGVCNLP